MYRVGFIGTGRPSTAKGPTGYAMAYEHADGYLKSGRCELVACADINEENANLFAKHYGFKKTYTDYHKMLASEKLDFVSICTWPHLHAPMVIAAAKAKVKSIHCEKPMSTNWGDAQRMAKACADNGVRLTFNHQRRFLQPFIIAKQLAHDGTIGELNRVEGNTGDMLDWGTHWLDMFFFYNNDTPADWVIGQIDWRREKKIFGVLLESQAICNVHFVNGVQGVLQTGDAVHEPVAHRLIGTEGMVEVHWNEPFIRVLSSKKKGWDVIKQPDNLHGPDSVERAMLEIVETFASKKKSQLDSSNALRATEVIFSTYESSRRRARIDLPLKVKDNPFLSMLEAGELDKVKSSARKKK